MLIGGVVHDRVAVVGKVVSFAIFFSVRDFSALHKLLLHVLGDVVHVYGYEVISVMSSVGVVHADAVQDLEWMDILIS